MFSPLSRGYAPWTPDLYEVYKDETTCSKEHLNLPHLGTEIHRHGITVTPRSRATSAISHMTREPTDGQINLPKTYLTRKGALVLFTGPDNGEDEENKPHDARQEKIIRLQRANEIIDTSLRLGTSGRLSKAILQFSDEDYDKDSASISDEKSKMFLKFLHRIDDRDVDCRSQPGSELSAYLRDLKSRASSRLSFSGDTHLPRSREALELRAILRGLQEDNWPISYSQDGASEQFTRPVSHISSRTGSPTTTTTASPRPILSARRLAASVKSLNSYMGRASPAPINLEEDEQVTYPTTISASVTRKHVTSPVSDMPREANFSPQTQKVFRRRSQPLSMTGSSILEEDERSNQGSRGGWVNDTYAITGTEIEESDSETLLGEQFGGGDSEVKGEGVSNVKGDGSASRSSSKSKPTSYNGEGKAFDTKTILTEGSDGSDLEVLYRAGESDNIDSTEKESDKSRSSGSHKKRTTNLVDVCTETDLNQNLSDNVNEESVNETIDMETSTVVSEDYFDAGTFKVDVVTKPITGSIQEEEIINQTKGEGQLEVKGHISPSEGKVTPPEYTSQDNAVLYDTYVAASKQASLHSTDESKEGEYTQEVEEETHAEPRVEVVVSRKPSLLEEVTQALEAENEDAASVASSVLIEQDIELPPEEQENQEKEAELTALGERRASFSQNVSTESQQYTGLTGRTSGGGFAIDSSLPGATNKEVSRGTPKPRRTSRPPSKASSTVVPDSRASSVGTKSPDLVKDSLEKLASSSFIEKVTPEPETLVSKQLDSIGQGFKIEKEVSKADSDQNEPIKTEDTTEVPETTSEDKKKVLEKKPQVKDTIDGKKKRKESEKKAEIKDGGKMEESKIDTKQETKDVSEKDILDALKAEANLVKGKKDVKKTQGKIQKHPQRMKPQQSKGKEEKKDYSKVLDITSVQPEEGEEQTKEALVKEEPEISPRLRKKAPPEKEKLVIPDFVADSAGRDSYDSYNELEKGVNKMSEMVDSELSAPFMANHGEGVSAEELELAKKAMAEKLAKATEKLDEMELPSYTPKKKKADEKSKTVAAGGKKGKKKNTKEQQNTLELERSRIREQQKLEKQRRLEEVKALQQRIAEKEEERILKEKEAKDRAVEIQLEMERLAKEAQQLAQAEEDVRQALADSRRKQREEREARRKAELERKKQEVLEKRERERKYMLHSAQSREQDMLAQIEDHDIKKRFMEDEARKLDEEERLAAERLEEEMEEIKRKAEEEEEREREIERQADEEAIQRLRDEEAEKDRERRRLAEEKQRMEEEKERERQMIIEEERIMLEQRKRREEEEDRMREDERRRLMELQRMEDEARMKMHQEIERRREAALHRRDVNLERRSNLDRVRQGQGVTKPWVFSYFINWPRETYMRPMGEDPNQNKKGFGQRPKKK